MAPQRARCCSQRALKWSAGVAVAVVVIVVIVLAVVLTRPAAPSAPVTVQVPVDAASAGAWTLAHGVNRAPRCADTGTPINADLAELGTTLIRTHDARVLDWWVIFPNPNADPEDPNNYNFTLGDVLFQQILDAGHAPYFRLGTSWPPGPPAVPAWSLCPNASLFARVSVHTVQHYNDAAWAGGFAGKRVRFWEIWNEPDGTNPLMWCGTPSEFYALFNATVYALKAYDPALLVGGPGVAHVSSADYSYGFLDFVVAAHTPFDFFSWHSYGTSGNAPEGRIVPAIDGVRAYLDQLGLGHVAQHTTEWYLDSRPPSQSVLESALAATYIASALSYFALHPSNVTLLYPACQGVAQYSWGLIKDNGDGTVAWRRETSAYLAVGQTLRDTPWRVATVAPTLTDFTVLAGRTAGPVGAGAPLNVSVVLSGQKLGNSRAVVVAFTGLPPNASAHVLVHLCDNTRAYTAVTDTDVALDAAGALNVTVPFSIPAVARVQLFVAGA